jgi:transcriptional regulator with XRE-family HTH domain
MVSEHLGDRIARLRRLADLTQEALAERSGVSVDLVRKLEQKRKHSARLPTLHALSGGLGVELTALLGRPSRDTVDRRAGPTAVGRSASRDHASAVRSSTGAEAALGKTLQLAGHLAIRLGKTDLAPSALERAMNAAERSSDPLLARMISNSLAWNYQRQNRLDDAKHLAVHAADGLERERGRTVEGLRVWGGLIMSAATSAARSGDYETAGDMMRTAEDATRRLTTLAPPADGRMVSVFSRSSVRIERVRLAVQHARPEEALSLAKGMRLGADIPPSWRTWLLLDVARAHTDVGDAEGTVKTLEKLRRTAPTWMRHHTHAVAVVTDLWAGSHRPPGLRKLAEFLGVAT